MSQRNKKVTNRKKKSKGGPDQSSSQSKPTQKANNSRPSKQHRKDKSRKAKKQPRVAKGPASASGQPAKWRKKADPVTKATKDKPVTSVKPSQQQKGKKCYKGKCPEGCTCILNGHYHRKNFDQSTRPDEELTGARRRMKENKQKVLWEDTYLCAKGAQASQCGNPLCHYHRVMKHVKPLKPSNLVLATTKDPGAPDGLVIDMHQDAGEAKHIKPDTAMVAPVPQVATPAVVPVITTTPPVSPRISALPSPVTKSLSIGSCMTGLVIDQSMIGTGPDQKEAKKRNITPPVPVVVLTSVTPTPAVTPVTTPVPTAPVLTTFQQALQVTLPKPIVSTAIGTSGRARELKQLKQRAKDLVHLLTSDQSLSVNDPKLSKRDSILSAIAIVNGRIKSFDGINPPLCPKKLPAVKISGESKTLGGVKILKMKLFSNGAQAIDTTLFAWFRKKMHSYCTTTTTDIEERRLFDDHPGLICPVVTTTKAWPKRFRFGTIGTWSMYDSGARGTLKEKTLTTNLAEGYYSQSRVGLVRYDLVVKALSYEKTQTTQYMKNNGKVSIVYEQQILQHIRPELKADHLHTEVMENTICCIKNQMVFKSLRRIHNAEQQTSKEVDFPTSRPLH